MCVAGRCCDIKSCHKMFQGKIPNLTKCENICHLSLQKFVWRRKKATFKKCGEKVQQKRNDVNHVIKTHTVAFSFHVFYTNWIFKCKKIPWTMFSYYQNEISNLDMQLNIDILTRLIWSPSFIWKWANHCTNQRHQMITTSCMVCLLKYGWN